MKIVVDINHPGHVHFFKNFIWEMEKRGHQVLITASLKDLSYTLLENYGFTYIHLGSYGNSLVAKILNLPLLDLKMYNVLKKINPDILIGIGSIRAAHASLGLKKPCICFTDTEHATEQILLYLPFTSAVLTPTAFKKNLGSKQIRYNGYHELAYLHPNRFTPDPAVLAEIGLTQDDPFIIIRFVSWQASHDVGQHGIGGKVTLVKELEKFGRVLITSEATLPQELQPYQIRVAPEKIHDLMYYATLYVGEGGTMASEAAVLGTHAIHISTTAKYCGNFNELNQYGLLSISENDKDTLRQAIELLRNPHIREEGKSKSKRLFQEKIDVTAFMVWFIEKYPESVTLMNENKGVQF